MKIEITTDTNATGWGSDCDDALAQGAAEKLAAMLATFAREEWPEAEVETRTHHYFDGESIEWARVTGTDAEVANNIEAAIGDFVEASWEEALQEALDEEIGAVDCIATLRGPVALLEDLYLVKASADAWCWEVGHLRGLRLLIVGRTAAEARAELERSFPADEGWSIEYA